MQIKRKFWKFFQYFNLKITLIKNKATDLKKKIKQRLEEYFGLENTLGHLMKLVKWIFMISIGFEQIYYGAKNPIRFKLCILTCISAWIATSHFIPFLMSKDLFLEIHDHMLSMPVHFRTFYLLSILGFGLMALIRTEFLLAEIKSNLDPFKVFYILMNNFKAKHKLNHTKYKTLGILSRLIIICLVDCGSTLIFVLGIIIIIRLAFKIRKIFWIVKAIVFSQLIFLRFSPQQQSASFLSSFCIINLDLIKSMINSNQLYQTESGKLLTKDWENN